MADELGATQNTLDGGASAASSNEPVQQASGGNEGTPSQTTAPASTPSPQPTGGTSQGQGAAAEAASQFQSIRDAAYEQYGLDLRNLPSDQAALQHLIGQASRAREAQQYQQYAQRYMQHASEFERWYAQQQQTQPQQPKQWWSPPEYNPAWKNLVVRDPESEHGFKLVPGAPPDILPKVLAYEQYRRDFADKLTSDPESTLKPFISEIAKEIAQAQVQQHLGGYQEAVFADNYIAQNSSWLHQRDPKTNEVVVDPFTRQPLLSPAGMRFRGYVEQLQASGITNSRVQEQLARAQVERDIAMAELSRYQAAQQNQQGKQQFLQQNNTRNPNQSGSLAPTPGTVGAPTNPALSLGERMRQKFREAGVTDADFAVNQGAGAGI